MSKKISNYKNGHFYQGWQLTKKIYGQSFFFIAASFLNSFLPLIVCLICSFSKQNGPYMVIGIGYVTAYQLAFCQLGFGMAIWICFCTKKKIIQQKQLSDQSIYFKESLLIIFLAQIIFTGIYVLTSYFYTIFVNNHINTKNSLVQGVNFTYSSALFIFLNAFLAYFILLLKIEKKTILANLFLLINFLPISSISFLLLKYTNWEGWGIGWGMSIGQIPMIILAFILIICLKKPFSIGQKFELKHIFYLIKGTYRPLLIILSLQIIKTIGLYFLFISIPEVMEGLVPLSYQMVRLLWYNLLYLIPFLFVGINDAINYYFIDHDMEINSKNIYFGGIILIALTCLISIGLTIGIFFIIEPLTKMYIKNDLGWNLTPDQKQCWIDKLRENFDQIWKEKIGFVQNDILDRIMQLLKEHKEEYNWIINRLIEDYILPKYTNFNLDDIYNMINLPFSLSFLYIAIFNFTYWPGNILVSLSNNYTKNKVKTPMIVFAQILAIIFIIVFGKQYQLSIALPLLDAWSFPLVCIGIIAFGYYSFYFFLSIDNYHGRQNCLNDAKIN